MFAPWKKSYDQPRQDIKKQRYYSADKGLFSQSYGFTSGVLIWELDHNESWAGKNWCFWTVVLEKTLVSPLDGKETSRSVFDWLVNQTSQSERKSVLNIHWKDWCWSWNSNTWATWCKELTHLKRPWCWERLKVGGIGVNRGWDG